MNGRWEEGAASRGKRETQAALVSSEGAQAATAAASCGVPPQACGARTAPQAATHRACVDPERPAVDVCALHALGVHKEERAREAANEHPLPRRQHACHVHTDAVRHADGRDARHCGVHER